MKRAILAIMILMLCGTAFAQLDYQNCGNGACEPGENCPADQCCNGNTVDLEKDEKNCGECGNSCFSTEFCLRGKCIRKCVDTSDCDFCLKLTDGSDCDCDAECASEQCIEQKCVGDTNPEYEEELKDMEEEDEVIPEVEEETEEPVEEITELPEINDTTTTTETQISGIEIKIIPPANIDEKTQLIADGETAITRHMLEASDNKLYMYDAQNYRVQIKIMPKKAKESLAMIEDLDTMTLNLDFENFIPIYRIDGMYKGQLFGFIDVEVKTTALISAIDGVVLDLDHPWWDLFVWG